MAKTWPNFFGPNFKLEVENPSSRNWKLEVERQLREVEDFEDLEKADFEEVGSLVS